MTQTDSTRQGSRPPEKPRSTRRDLLVGIGAFLGFIIVSAGLLVAFSPATGRALRQAVLPPDREGHARITVIHSNDTWGYTLPCG